MSGIDKRRNPYLPIPQRNQKRSFAVPLLALGGIALVGASVVGRGQDVQRNRYDSYADCVRDYSSEQCQMDTSVNGSGGGLHYYGPWYRSGGGANDPGPGRMLAAGGRLGGDDMSGEPRAIELGTRGGFGSTGRVFARAS